jgi:ABC-type multidrug transport system fused ATPase/permease subunit
MSSLLLDSPSQLDLAVRLSACEKPWEPSRATQTTVLGAEDAASLSSLRNVFRTYRWRVLLTYGLFNLENLLGLARPWVLGLAIDDLLHSSCRGAVLLAVQQLGFMLLSTGRQMYDTRAFTRIYADLATGLVLQQRRHDVETSRVAARSALSREIVDFFEHNLPYVFQSLYSVLGAIVMLALCDGWMVPVCLTLLAPVYFLSVFYAHRTYALNSGLNNELEREVEIIGRARPQEVRRHYDTVRQWRIRLSNYQAMNCCLLHLFVMGLISTALVRCCLTNVVEAGQIFAVLGYVMMFVMGLGNVPALVQQLSRLRDITRRVLGLGRGS